MTKTRLLSLDTEENVFVKAIFIVKFHMCEDDMCFALENIVMVELSKYV